MYYRVFKETNPCVSFPEFVYNLYLFDEGNNISSRVSTYECLVEADRACNRANLRIRADLRHQS